MWTAILDDGPLAGETFRLFGREVDELYFARTDAQLPGTPAPGGVIPGWAMIGTDQAPPGPGVAAFINVDTHRPLTEGDVAEAVPVEAPEGAQVVRYRTTGGELASLTDVGMGADQGTRHYRLVAAA